MFTRTGNCNQRRTCTCAKPRTITSHQRARWVFRVVRTNETLGEVIETLAVLAFATAAGYLLIVALDVLERVAS